MKSKYIALCNAEESIPIFFRPWWLDAVCGEQNWDVVVVEKGGTVYGALPYCIKNKYGFMFLTQPVLTQYLGPWIRYPVNQKYEKKLSHEKKILVKLIKNLPKYSLYRQNLRHTYTNWLPFFWSGFCQTTRYTYLIEDLSDLDRLWSNIQSRIKTDIKKASTKYDIELVESEDIEEFYRINLMTFSRQGLPPPYSLELLKKLDQACRKRKCRKILFAVDDKGNIHAALFLVWDKDSAYYLIGGADPKLRNSGATSFLVWEAIKLAAQVSEKFDFEGSMIESVENFIRGFGGIQKPYHSIYSVKSRTLKIAKAFSDAFKT